MLSVLQRVRSTSEIASSTFSENDTIHVATSETSEKVAEAQNNRSEDQVKRLQVLALDLYTYRAQALEILGRNLLLKVEIWL